MHTNLHCVNLSSKFAVGMVDLFANNSEGEPFNYFLLTAFVTPKK
ncbi:hypothetical protein ENHYD8BJ_140160 [Enhydrobacter sp. 8BJ]|nr:hypothetical protein ENHYD8BJ_140160 [Enhydrobacter sp. 8BJ]